MSQQPYRSGNERVTMRTLSDGLDIVRAEQKTEHTKTRAMIVILSIPNVLRAIPFVLGAVDAFHVVFGWFPW